MIAKKSLGQHWLNDEASLQAIVEAGGVKPNDTILEIGPGQGSLSEKLLDKGARVIAVEKDERLADKLTRNFPEERFSCVSGDILQFNLAKLPRGYKIIANIPYYLTSHLIRVLSETPNPPSKAVLLVQEEVAKRLAGRPGQMSLLSVTTQMFYKASLGEVVSADLFEPPPKVNSQIAILIRRREPIFGDMDSKPLFRVVKAGFSSRRKTLENSLSAGLRMPKSEIATNLQFCNIDPKSRPQELTLEQWAELARSLIQ